MTVVQAIIVLGNVRWKVQHSKLFSKKGDDKQ